jgi:small subunit ribosomal protein S2
MTKTDTNPPAGGKKTIISETTAQEMLEANVHFGHKKSNWNPKMKSNVFETKGNIYIIDLEKTMEQLEKAINFLKEIKKNNGKILFAETRPQGQAIIKEVAKDLKMPYVVARWIGGLLTNFKNLRKRVEYFIDLEKRKNEGDLKKYTKKEQLDLDREIEKLKKRFEGVRELDKLPDAVFVLSIKTQMTVIREAQKKNIPIVALADTDSDPTLVDYPIPANDESISSIKYIMTKIQEALKED